MILITCGSDFKNGLLFIFPVEYVLMRRFNTGATFLAQVGCDAPDIA